MTNDSHHFENHKLFHFLKFKIPARSFDTFYVPLIFSIYHVYSKLLLTFDFPAERGIPEIQKLFSMI